MVLFFLSYNLKYTFNSFIFVLYVFYNIKRKTFVFGYLLFSTWYVNIICFIVEDLFFRFINRHSNLFVFKCSLLHILIMLNVNCMLKTIYWLIEFKRVEYNCLLGKCNLLLFLISIMSNIKCKEKLRHCFCNRPNNKSIIEYSNEQLKTSAASLSCFFVQNMYRNFSY